jgi:Fic family protein
MHYQFESIHPFEDGNGRTGRLLIVSQLLINGTLSTGVLNLSQYFDQYRDEYVAALRSVSDTHDYRLWITFFLEAVISQCEHNISLVKSLKEIKEKNEVIINGEAHSPAALQVLNHSLNRLYITTPDTVNFLGKKGLKGDLKQMARNNIKKLEALGILEKTSRKIGKSEVYVHRELKNKLIGSHSN